MKLSYFVISVLIGLPAFASTELSLETAKKVAAVAAKFAAKKEWKVSIAIVNSEGNLVYFERNDGTYVGSVAAAIDKAKSANAFERPTRAFVQALKDGRTGLTSIKDVVAVEGGVPLMDHGKYIGAIGVSGGKATEDDEAATAAAESLGGKK